ncbi:MAG: hypothetical protein MRK01_08670 [Candidatus Scalindua sp.]|nr:hypothetical protein [Candidatus Scalindua sp.]
MADKVGTGDRELEKVAEKGNIIIIPVAKSSLDVRHCKLNIWGNVGGSNLIYWHIILHNDLETSLKTGLIHYSR